MPPRRAGRSALVALAVALLVGACGDERRTASARDGRLEVRLDDFLLDPQRIRADAGEPFTLVLRNRGRAPHNLKVLKGLREVAGTTTLLPGRRRELRLELPRGDYRLASTIANQDELGLRGTLTVR